MRKNEWIGLSVAFAIFAVVVYVLISQKMIIADRSIELIILLILASATIIYAKRTSEIATATRKQAEEMREQRIMTARPVIIQKAVVEEEKKIRAISDPYSPNYFSHFEIYNVGNGPAIELEISLLPYKEKGAIPPGERQTFLRAGQSITFYPPNLSNLPKPAKYYLVSEYQSTLSRSAKPTWYQTWLLFELYKSSIEGKMEVVSGDLEFHDEVPEKDRINAFRGSKPK